MVEPRRLQRRVRQAVAAHTFGAALLVGGLGMPAWAQDDPTVLEEVLVTGEKEKRPASPKYTAPLRDIPQTITIIPEEMIEEQGASTLRDVLRIVPGISIQAGEGGVPLGDNLTIRGFAARTDMFVDGVRDIAGYSRDPFSVEQVEVSKGPASAYAGRGSTGGSINMVTKTPRAEAFRDATAGFGGESYKRFTFDINQPIGEKTAVRMNALWHDAGIPGRNVTEEKRWGAAPSLALGLGTPTRLTLSYLHLDQDNIPDYGIPWVPATNNVLVEHRDKPAPVDYDNFYGITARDFEEVKTDVATAIVERDFSSALTLRNLSRWGQTDRESIVSAPRFASNNSTLINRQMQDRDDVTDVLANQTDLTFKLGGEAVRHTLVTGVEVARETTERNRLTAPAAPQADLYNPDPSQAFSGSGMRSGARTEGKSDSLGVYAFDTIKLGEQWEVPLGLRWDSFGVDFEDRAVNGTVTSLNRTDRMLSWRGGVVFKPQPQGSLYAGYGTSFNPAGEGLSLSAAATNAANVNVKPEESRTLEVGSKWDVLNGRLALTTALFRTDKVNARTEDPTNPGDVVVLEGKERVDGLELGATGKIIDRWDVFAAATFLDSEVVSSKDASEVGKQLPNTPKTSYNLWTSYRLPWRLQVGAGVQHVGDRFNNTANARKAPSYTLYDAMVSYDVTKNVGLRVNAYNLTDEDYIDRVGGGHIIPGAGRVVTVRTDVKF
jgi:catecholate siderophore receptor